MNRFPLDPSDPDDEAPSSEFAHRLEEFERGPASARQAERAAVMLSPGAKVRGKVIAIAAGHALIDVGARSEASADLADFRNDDGSLRIAVGELLDLFVVEAGEQIVLAASVRGDPRAGLAALRDARAAGMPVSGRVTGVNSGGLQVDLAGVRGFCPVSQIESGYCADPSVYVGRSLEFLVTGLEEGRRSVVLSRRQLVRRQEEEAAARRLAELKPGDELEGTVRRLEPFGAFVDLGGIEGMVHVSEIRHGRIAHPRDVLREGESVRVRVLRIDQDKSGRPRLALSIKAAAPDPWAAIESRYPPGTRVKGIVSSLADFGAFVTLEPGIDGLVHVSEVASRRTERVRDVLTLGQEVEAVVLGVDAEKKRISLSIRAAMAAAEDAAAAAELPPPAPAAIAEEPTTMAIALRKAAEKASQKQARGPTEKK
jgi:small subunit ribosomal protein S1